MKIPNFYSMVILFIVLFLTGCKSELNELGGQLKLTQILQLNRIVSGSPQTYEFKAGVYAAVVQINDSHQNLYLKVNDQIKNPTFNFKIPSTIHFSDGLTEFEITSAQSGQPIDLHGTIHKNSIKSEIINDEENCMAEVPPVFCSPHPGEPPCTPEIGWKPGIREVAYQTVKTEIISNTEIKKDSFLIGTFTARDIETKKVYIDQGECHLNIKIWTELF